MLLTNLTKGQKAQYDHAEYLRGSVSVMEGYGSRGAKPRPFRQDLAVKKFGGWLYGAAMLNANAMASVRRGLYVRKGYSVKARREWFKMSPAEQKAWRAKGGKVMAFNTRPIPLSRKKYLYGDLEHRPSNSVMRKVAEFGDDFEEVVEGHPILDVLDSVNPWQNGFELTVLRMIYLQLTGNWYLHPVINAATGTPQELWLCPSQWMEIVPDRDNLIKGYRYGREPDVVAFQPDEIIHGRLENVEDPLYYGRGCAEAAWTAIGLSESKRVHDLSYHDNMARPDWMVGIEGANGDALQAVEQSIEQRLRGPTNAGKMLAVSGKLTATALNFPLQEIGDPDRIIEEIAIAFGVPMTKLLANDPNLANAETGNAGWMRDTILPHCRRDEEKLNEAYVPLFGLEGDAFIAYDNPVPANRDFELREKQASVGGPWRAANEVREEEGRDPLPGQDHIGPPPATPEAKEAAPAPAVALVTGAVPPPLPPEVPTPPVAAPPISGTKAMGEPAQVAPAAPALNLTATVAGSSAILAVQAAYFGGGLVREAAVAHVQMVFGFTPEQAQMLFPPKPPAPPPPIGGLPPDGPPQGGPAGDSPQPPAGGMDDAGVKTKGNNPNEARDADGKWTAGGGSAYKFTADKHTPLTPGKATTGSVETADGDHAGNVAFVSPEPGGHAKIDTVTIRDGHQGKGAVQDVMRHVVEHAKSMDGKGIKLTANIGVGGYAWAKYGFTPVDAGEWDKLRATLKSKMDLVSFDSAEHKSAVADILNSDDPKSVGKLADIDHPVTTKSGDRKKAGAWLLLGERWEGKLDFADDAAMDRFNKYMGSKDGR